MRATVIYESMYGNTRKIAEAIAEGIGGEASVCAVAFVASSDLDVDLLVVGGPTHAHSLSRPSTRKSAEDRSRLKQVDVAMDAFADMGTGVREWLEEVHVPGTAAAAFDTRVHGPAFLTGRAGKGIARRLRHAGARVIAEPESFFVKHEQLVDGELDRARAFGKMLAEKFALNRAA